MEKHKETHQSASSYVEVTDEERRLFPENFSEKINQSKWYLPRFFNKDRREEKINCEKNVIHCIGKYPLVQIMLNALEKSGCEVNLKRHFSCEVCTGNVSGGYDARKNKIIICQNKKQNEKYLYRTISHELMHMFDYCRSDFDYRNLEHIACSEIRAASLFDCSYWESVFTGRLLAFNWFKGFHSCVKSKVVQTLLATGRTDSKEAKKIVDKVFDRCFNDLEPVGKRYAHGLHRIDQQERCYEERHIFGYGYDRPSI